MNTTFSVAALKAGPSCIAEVPSGVFCIGAMTDPDGQFLYLSLVGRDTALQEIRGQMTAGKLDSFIVQWDDQKLSGWFSRERLGKMEYHGARMQTALFGEVSQMILYHPLMTKPNKANQVAVVPFLGDIPSQDVWNAVKHVSDVALLDSWECVVMELLEKLDWKTNLDSFGCQGVHVGLGSNFAGLVSANIRSGALCAEPDEYGRHAYPDKITLDIEYGKHQTQSPQPSNPADSMFGEVIYTYSRSQAIEDGVLVDVSHTSEARDAGFRVPVALTRTVWERFVSWDEGQVSGRQWRLGQSTNGRLWDVLYMAFLAIRRASAGGNTLLYQLHVIERDGYSTQPNLVELKLHSGSGDNGEHVITIMLPEED